MGVLRFAMATWIIYAIPVALLMFIVWAASFIAQHRPDEGSLVGWTFFAGQLPAGWIGLIARSFRS